MLFLDVLFRFSAVGLLFMLSILAFRDKRDSWSGWLLGLLCVSLMGLLIGTAPTDLNIPRNIRRAARLIDVPNTILVWLFVKSLMSDDFRMNRWHWLLAALWCLPLWLMRFDIFGFYDIFTSTHIMLLNLFGLGLFLYLLYFIIKGAKDDLVQPRRRLRLYFVIFTILIAVLAIASEFILIGDKSQYMFLSKILFILPVLMAAYLWMVIVRPDHFAFGKTVSPSTDFDPEKLKYKDAQLYEKLQVEMTEKKAWLEPDLTIPKLAKRLGVTEHKLRALINQQLGFRNFSRFLNGYRIDAIKQAFAIRETRETPILTLVLDNGFNSLPPFNRAFKQIEGMTPSQYRQSLK